MSTTQPLKFSAFEEDDEFEEFEVEDWKKEDEEATDMKLWEDNWDEDDFEDDFSKQLRAELDKVPKILPLPQSSAQP